MRLGNNQFTLCWLRVFTVVSMCSDDWYSLQNVSCISQISNTFPAYRFLLGPSVAFVHIATTVYRTRFQTIDETIFSHWNETWVVFLVSMVCGQRESLYHKMYAKQVQMGLSTLCYSFTSLHKCLANQSYISLCPLLSHIMNKCKNCHM